MSGPPRVRSMNIATEPDPRPVLGPAGNKAPQRPASKPIKKSEKPALSFESKDKKLNSQSPVAVSHPTQCVSVPSNLRQQEHNLARTASWSSDASSSDSSHSRASSNGRVAAMALRSGTAVRRKQCALKVEKSEKSEKSSGDGGGVVGLVESSVCLEGKKRCAWVSPTSDPCYALFHDEEWGVPVHDDKKLFELLSLSGALAELTWPTILNKRHIFRKVFLEFDPFAVSKLNEKKIATPGSPASSLLSEIKLRAIVENARLVCKVIDEFGSFNKYIWNFVNHRPIVSQFRYPRQVPVKSPKAEVISKDLIRRGFRSVGPTVIYTFMQVAGLTNDHLIICFRFPECIARVEAGEKDGLKTEAENIDGLEADTEKRKPEEAADLGRATAMDDLSLSSK